VGKKWLWMSVEEYEEEHNEGKTEKNKEENEEKNKKKENEGSLGIHYSFFFFVYDLIRTKNICF